MNIMESRFIHLIKSIEALQKTGLYFLLKHESIYSSIAKKADDIGLFYFIPCLVKNFDISLVTAIDYFFYSLLTISIAFAVVSFGLIGGGFAALAFLLNFFIVHREGFFLFRDVYIASVFITFFVIPFTIYLFDRKKTSSLALSTWMFIVGILSTYSHYLRIYSSLSVLVFLILLLLSKRKKITLLIPLFLGLMIPYMHMSYLKQKSVKFLVEQNVNVNDHPYQHCFWHAVYCGLGFVEDKNLGIRFDDRCAVEKVHEFDPDAEIGSFKYENILKKEVFSLFIKKRFIVGRIIFMKIGVILFFFLACANIGAIIACFYPKGYIEYVFAFSLFIAALPGILVIPSLSYLSGFVSLSFIYGIYSFVFAMNSFFGLRNE